MKKDAGATVVYKFTKNKKPSVKKTGKFLLVKFNMKFDKKRIKKGLEALEGNKFDKEETKVEEKQATKKEVNEPKKKENGSVVTLVISLKMTKNLWKPAVLQGFFFILPNVREAVVILRRKKGLGKNNH